MKILLINHYAGSIKHGMEYRPFYMAREWVRLGHEVTIIAASNSHVRTCNPQIKGNMTHEVIEGVHYIWLKTPAYSGNGVGRVKNMLSFTNQLLLRRIELARTIKPDVVIASSTYPLDNYPASKIARLASAKLIYEVHDLWPLSPMEIGGMSKWHPFIMLMQWAENYAYKHCDRVVSMLPLAESHMLKHGLAEGKFCYVPNGIDTSEWLESKQTIPQEQKDILDALQGEGRFLVCYAGAHGPANALERLMEAAALTEGSNAVFILVGQGPDKEKLIKTASNMRLNNVRFLPAVPKASIPSLLSKMDVLYIGLAHKSLFRFGISPNKLMDYMMAAKPVVQSIDAGNDMVSESGCGISISTGSQKDIADAVLTLMKMNPEERSRMGARGHEYVLKSHDYSILAKRFLEAFV
ncbi:MAG: glycosyltransferase family 4 protein [Armatimonadota bacterium]